MLIFIGSTGNQRQLIKILMRRRSFDCPFQCLPSPYISFCNYFAFAHSINKISKHNYHTCYQNPRTNSCDLVVESIFREIIIISSWHSQPAHDKHWEIECIEPDKYYPEGNLCYRAEERRVGKE